MNIFSIAFTLFILMDSIGNIPLYISFLKKLPPKRQRFIIVRELLIALFIIVLFDFVGDWLMEFLQVTSNTIQISGGIILFLLCLKMIFPTGHDANGDVPRDEEPFIVPLAVPLVAGPATLAAVIIYAKQASSWTILGAILMAWIATLIVLLGSSFLQKILGWRGIIAVERLMGLILSLIAIQMFLSGLGTFLLQNTPSGP